MNRYRDANFVQIAAFHRAVYSFAVLVAGLFLRTNNVIGGDWVRPILLAWQFLLYSAIPMLFIKSTGAEERTQMSPNLEFAWGLILFAIDFFKPSPISNKLPYRAFRATLGIFVLPIFVGYFLVLVPLILVEMAICRLRTLTTKTAG